MTGTYIGYGFAIPINIAKVVAEDLIESGKVKRGYIGVRIEEVDADLAKAVGLDKPQGILIQQVIEDGAASKEDIKAGDIIIDVDGNKINKPNQLQSYVASKRTGDKIKLNIFRNGKYIPRKIKLKSRSNDNTEEKENREITTEKKNNNYDKIEFDEIGLTVRNMNSSEYHKSKVKNGVIITKVERFSKAENQKLFRGLVITEIDRKKIETVSEMKEILEDKKGEAILLKVVDAEGTSRYVGIELPN